MLFMIQGILYINIIWANDASGPFLLQVPRLKFKGIEQGNRQTFQVPKMEESSPI